MDRRDITIALLVVTIVVVGWTALEVQRLHADLDPLLSSSVATALANI